MQMPWGKHKGKELRDIPESYLTWVLDKAEMCTPTLRRAIEERLGISPTNPATPPPPSGLSASEQLVRTWGRQMALKYHPDRGGSQSEMLVVNEGLELLKRLAGL